VYVDTAPKDGGWTGALEISSRVVVGTDPAICRTVCRAIGSGGPFKAIATCYPVLVAPFRRVAVVTAIDDIAVRAENAVEETFELTPVVGGTRFDWGIVMPVRGIYNLLRHVRVYKRMLARVAARCENRPMPGPIKGIGWFASLAFAGLAACGLAALFGVGGGYPWKVYLLLGVTVQSAVIIHEFGHWLALRWFGHRDASIVSIPFFGGAAVATRPYASQFEKAIVSLMGPGFTALVLIFLLPVIGWAVDALDILEALNQGSLDISPEIRADLLKGMVGLLAILFALFAALINLWNLAPVGMLDGAKIVSALSYTRKQAWLYSIALLAAILCCVGGSILSPTPGAGIALLVLVWAVGRRSGGNMDASMNPMTARQRVLVVSALSLTIYSYAFVTQHVIGDFIERMSAMGNQAMTDDGL
jgi:Zn-dependent protease